MTAPADVPVHLRPAVPADALCLGVLAAQVFLDTYAVAGVRPALAREVLACCSPAAYEALLADGSVAILVAERDAHLVGFAQLAREAVHPLAPGLRGAELRRLYVQERFTGGGLGRRLLAAAEATAAASGAQALWLTAWVGNARALAFYPRCGYRDAGATTYEFEGESHENRFFVKPLRDGSGPR